MYVVVQTRKATLGHMHPNDRRRSHRAMPCSNATAMPSLQYLSIFKTFSRLLPCPRRHCSHLKRNYVILRKSVWEIKNHWSHLTSQKSRVESKHPLLVYPLLGMFPWFRLLGIRRKPIHESRFEMT